MTDHEMSPLFALAAAPAYMIQSDADPSTQEKAELLTVFGKLLVSDEKTVRIIREILMLRNDISLFINPSHPFNNDDFDLAHLLRGK